LPSLTIENYVKTIHELCARQSGRPAATGQIATALRVSPGTVTSMLKTLSESGMVEYTPYEGVRLTASGRVLARRVLRRHRLIELFLVQTLKFSWDEVHDEAEHMEHAVSDLLIDRIDAFLNYPTADPHGDPIPQADGSLPTANCLSLFQCEMGTRFRLVRVMDQEPPFLRYLDEIGLSLGVEGRIVENRAEMGVVTIEAGNRETTLGRESAEKLLIIAVDSSRLTP
jgi:DtxR family Mn-dependent transcriptional regulator